MSTAAKGGHVKSQTKVATLFSMSRVTTWHLLLTTRDFPAHDSSLTPRQLPTYDSYHP